MGGKNGADNRGPSFFPSGIDAQEERALSRVREYLIPLSGELRKAGLDDDTHQLHDVVLSFAPSLRQSLNLLMECLVDVYVGMEKEPEAWDAFWKMIMDEFRVLPCPVQVQAYLGCVFPAALRRACEVSYRIPDRYHDDSDGFVLGDDDDTPGTLAPSSDVPTRVYGMGVLRRDGGSISSTGDEGFADA